MNLDPEVAEAFRTDPIGTASRVTEALMEQGYAYEQATQAAFEAQQEALGPHTDPRMDEMYGQWQQERELRAYDEALDEILADPVNQDINRDLYHGFVAAADGDFDMALQLYRHDAAMRQKEVIDSLGLTPEQVAEFQRQNRNRAPAVIGSGYGAGDDGGPSSGALGHGGAHSRGQRGLDEAIERAAAAVRR